MLRWVASGSQGDVFRAEMRADGSSVCVKKPALDDFENFEEMLKVMHTAARAKGPCAVDDRRS